MLLQFRHRLFPGRTVSGRKCLLWNRGAERLMGYSAAEIVGQTSEVFYLPEAVAEGLPARLLNKTAAEGRCEDEGWRVRKDGSHFYADVVLNAIRSPDGELIGFAEITRNVTRRKQAENALRLSEERLRLLVGSIKDHAVFMLDPEGCVMTWNEGAKYMKGYEHDQIVGRPMATFYRQEDVAAGRPAHLLSVAEAEGHAEDEGWRIRKDGSEFYATVAISAMRDDAGKLVGFAKVTRDLTERRGLIAQLKVANAQLSTLAMRDGLTGLANRRHFDESLAREYLRARRSRLPISLVMIDIDRFKAFNDRYGHLHGDNCIRRVAETLASSARRPADLVARFGGEEFAIILPETPVVAAREIARSAMEEIRSLRIAHQEGLSGIVSVSAGVSCANPSRKKSPKGPTDLVQAADAALYRAKAGGRDTLEVQLSEVTEK